MRGLSRGIRDFFTKADIFLLAIGVMCTGYGLLLISSAARIMPRGARPYMVTQIWAGVIGIAVFVVFSLIDIKVYARFWKWIAGFNVGFILLLIPFGGGGGGNKSWLRFESLPFDIQSAEVVKVSFVILMALHMYALKNRINRVLPFLSLLAHLGVMVGLILFISEDLGVAFIYVFTFFCMLIGAGVKPRWFLILGAMAGGVMPLLWNWMNDTRRSRLLYFFYPEADPLDFGYHVLQSKRAFGNGGRIRTGAYAGPQTQSFRPPRQQADFV
ncbi:MAG: FtsW/RodA/SpoVE family cell cycle protein, partial [Oscillospiraceae bacterium]|nr:FtsW/RodA/SpoVE family cell cycle protein [Oscillospiraceae bacterium]